MPQTTDKLTQNQQLLLKLSRFVLAWRLILLIPLIISFFFLNPRPRLEYTQLNLYAQKPPTFTNHLHLSLSNFDGIHYLNIASSGYIDEGRFLPFYSLLIKLFSFNAPAYSAKQVFTAQAISLVSLIVFFYYLSKLKLFSNLSDSSDSNNFSDLVYLLFPTSFFLAATYTESLFLSLTAASFFAAQKKQWGRAFLLASLTSLTRLTGIVVIASIAYEYLQEKKVKLLKIKNFLTFGFFLLVSSLPLSFYSLFNYFKWNDWLYFIHAHSNLANGRTTSFLINPLQTLYRYSKIFLTFNFSQYEYWIAGLELISFLFATSMIYWLWKNKLKPSYLVYSILSLLLPVLSGTFSGLPRYLLTIFPIFLALGHLVTRKKVFQVSYFLISGFFLLVFLILFSRGYYIS